MSLTYEEAVDDMSAMFKDVWDTTGHFLHWESVKTQRDTADDPWARFVIRHATGNQNSLGGVGARDFRRNGTIIISIFVPIGKGLSSSSILAKLATDAYEGEHSINGVWFRNVRLQEVGRDGEFFQTNVLVEFEYYETK